MTKLQEEKITAAVDAATAASTPVGEKIELTEKDKTWLKLEQGRERVDESLESADRILSEIRKRTRQVLFLFEMDMGDYVVRWRKETPYALKEAASWSAALEMHLESIDQTAGDSGNVNRAERAVLIANLVDAYVKATLARAIVEFWKGAPGLASFQVLAHQAIAYSDGCRGRNFTYYAPLAFIHQHEPIDKGSKAGIHDLMRYGQAALGYAECLHHQMHALPVHLRLKVQSIRVQRGSGEDSIEKVTPARFPACRAPVVDGASQADIAKVHCALTGEDFREDAWLGLTRHQTNPKVRLTGFSVRRGGARHKKRQKRK